jgi:outer membrane protein OmpA-like peptidoglycan-associated protein
MKIKTSVLLTSVALATLALTGCGKNGLHGSSGSPIINGSRSAHGTEVNGVSGTSSFDGENFGGDALAASNALSKTIYFGFDKYNLTNKAEQVASDNAMFLLKNPSMHVMIEGHTDPRGSESYNFHLGERRASAVQSYLLQRGVPASQICTVSYGELRPAATPSQFGGDKLKAYALDRRAVIGYDKTCEGTDSVSTDTVMDDSPAPVVHKAKMKKKKTSAVVSSPAPVSSASTVTTTVVTPSVSSSS